MDAPDHESPAAFAYAHERYSVIRHQAFTVALARVRARGPVPAGAILTSLSPRVIEAYQLQWQIPHWTGSGGWPWTLLAHRFVRKPRSFHAALWQDSLLCGLCVGWVSKGRQNLTLRYLESAPDPHHPLRGWVTTLMFEAALQYASALSVQKLLLRDPVPGLVGRYEEFGFRVDHNTQNPVYLERIIREGWAT